MPRVARIGAIPYRRPAPFREDDADSKGALSALRDRIQRERRGQLGRSPKNFRLWQDKEAIAPGTLWELEIKAAVSRAVFFVPIITPTMVGSDYCRFEFTNRKASCRSANPIAIVMSPL